MAKHDKRILLPVDNASNHNVDTEYSQIRVKRLPANLTAHWQPMEAGISSSFEGYRSNGIKSYLKAFDNGTIFKMNINDAIVNMDEG